MRIKPILIIAGDPESVFYEIFLKSLKNNKFKSPIILIGSIRILKFFQKKLNFNKKITLLDIEKLSTYKLNNSSINLIDVKLSKSDKDSKIYLKKISFYTTPHIVFYSMIYALRMFLAWCLYVKWGEITSAPLPFCLFLLHFALCTPTLFCKPL